MRKLSERFLNWITVERAAWLTIALAFLIFVVGTINHQLLLRYGPNGSFIGETIEQYYANLSAELFSIAVTVFVIDRLYQRREKGEHLDQLKKDFSSSVNEIALRASKELRRLGYLHNDKLHNSTFVNANLANAHLEGCRFKAEFIGGSFKKTHFDRAEFYECEFHHVNFNKADLSYAIFVDCVFSAISFNNAILKATIFKNTKFEFCDFTGAINLNLFQLGKARKFWKTRLMDGKMYDGRFNLEDDLAHAKESRDEYVSRTEKDKVSDQDEFMADFYGVSVKRYRKGQKWWKENRDVVKLWANQIAQYQVMRNSLNKLTK